jgi:AsmA protein
MPKAIKIILIVIAAIVGLLVAAAAIVAATFNPNDYKPTIIKLVQEKKQRTLAIPGDIKLTFFPKIGADLGQVSVSEHGAPAEFASIRHAKVSLALIPLLSKQLVVDRVVIDGLHANIKRYKDGTTNFDDFLSKEESSSQQVKFDISGVQVTNSSVAFDDQKEGRKLAIDNVDLETGKIADGAASKFEISADVKNNLPAVDAKVSAKSGFTFELASKHYTLKGIDASIKGRLLDFTDVLLSLKGDADLKPEAKQFALDGIAFGFEGKQAKQAIEFKLDAPKLAITDKAVSGGKISGDAKLSEGGRTISAKFGAPSFEGSPQAFKLPALTLDATVKDAELDASVKLSGALAGNLDKMLFTSPQLTLALDGKQGSNAINGSLTTPLNADLKADTIELPGIAASFTLPNPGGGTLKMKANGRAGVDLGKHTANAALKGNIDESNFDAKFGLAKFSPAAYTFDIGIDRIDLDRYRSPASGKPAAPASAPAAAAVPEKPIDLSALKTLNANGTLRIDAVKVQNLKASNLRVGIHAANGKAEINPLNANLYGGTVAGSLSAVTTEPPQFTVRQNLAGINVGALLKDAIAKDPVDGKGNVQIDVTTSGATVTQMKRSLGGTAKLELRDGAVRGVNVAQVIRDAKAKIGAVRGDAPAQTGTGSADQKTDFSELSGSFHIAKGVAHNEDLSVKSPLLRIGGAGDVDLGADRLDYVIKAAVVTTLQGQGGPELQALKGLTVPVRLSGPFTAIGWKVDFAGMVGDVARQKLDEKKEDVKKKLQDQLQDKLKGLFGK